MTGHPARPGGTAAALWSCALLAACCAHESFTRTYPVPDAQELLAAVRARHQAVRSADLDTRTTSWLRGERTRATVVMLVERDGRLRFEAEVSLQGAVATLVTTRDTFALLDLQAHVFKHGQACPENVGQLVPVPLLPVEVAAVLLGDAPLDAGARALGVDWDGREGADVLGVDNGAGGLSQRLFVKLRRADGGARWDVVGVEGERAGGRWRVAYGELAVEAGVAHPNVIRFAEPGKSFDDGVEIKVKSRRVNPELKAQAFTLTPPEGYPVEVVPCCPGCPTPR